MPDETAGETAEAFPAAGADFCGAAEAEDETAGKAADEAAEEAAAACCCIAGWA